MRRLLIFGCAVGIIAGHNASNAQSRRVELRRLGVDCVTVEKGPRLLGAVMDRDADGGMTIAVQREWLKQTAPRFYRNHHQRELDELRDGAARLPNRIRQWKTARPNDEELQRFLDAELVRIERAAKQPRKPADALDSQFAVVTVPAKQVRFSYLQPAKHRSVAVLAWRERLKDVESRSAVELLRELREKQIDPVKKAADLSDRFPALPDDEKQWAARQALIEYDFRQRLDFQGTGDVLFRTDDEEALPALPELLTAMFRSELGNQLGELLGGDLFKGGKAAQPVQKREFDTAKKAADKLAATGFRVMRVQNNLAAKTVSVESRFLARLPGGKWETIWQFRKTLDATKERDELEERIQADPRVKQSLKLVEALGGEEAKAIPVLGFASATMQGQQYADDAFVEFRLRYTKQVDGPVLRWSDRSSK